MKFNEHNMGQMLMPCDNSRHRISFKREKTISIQLYYEAICMDGMLVSSAQIVLHYGERKKK